MVHELEDDTDVSDSEVEKSLFVIWMSLEQQNVLFDLATLQKPQSSFRDKILNIMVA